MVKDVLQFQKSNRVTGCVGLHSKENGGDAMKKRKHKKHISLNGNADIWHIPSGIAYIRVYVL